VGGRCELKQGKDLRGQDRGRKGTERGGVGANSPHRYIHEGILPDDNSMGGGREKTRKKEVIVFPRRRIGEGDF